MTATGWWWGRRLFTRPGPVCVLLSTCQGRAWREAQTPGLALRWHRWPSTAPWPSQPQAHGAVLTPQPPDPGAEAPGAVRTAGPAGTPSVCGEARGVKACRWPGWGVGVGSSGQPRPRDANGPPRTSPRSEEEPHAAGGEHAPVRENQQLHRGPGPGRGDAAGPHHPRVTVSAAARGGRVGGRVTAVTRRLTPQPGAHTPGGGSRVLPAAFGNTILLL